MKTSNADCRHSLIEDSRTGEFDPDDYLRLIEAVGKAIPSFGFIHQMAWGLIEALPNVIRLIDRAKAENQQTQGTDSNKIPHASPILMFPTFQVWDRWRAEFKGLSLVVFNAPESVIDCLRETDLPDEWKGKIPHQWQIRVLYVISTILMIRWCHKEDYRTKGCGVPLYSPLLKSVLGNQYHAIIELAERLALIENCGSYVVDRISKRFRLCERHWSSRIRQLWIPVESPNRPFLQRIKKSRVQVHPDHGSSGEIQDPVLTLIEKNLKRLDFSDMSAVDEALIQRYGSKRDAIDSQRHFLDSIQAHDTYFKEGRFGRVYTTFGSLIRQARPSLRLHGKPLVSVDVSGSHPFLLNCWYPNSASKEARFHRELVTEGRFYEEIIRLMESQPPRDVFKKAFMMFLNGHSLHWGDVHREIASIHKRLFPELHQLITDVKQGSLKSGNYKRVSHRLMTDESELIVRGCGEALIAIDPDFPFITLHDAIYTTPDRVVTVLNVLRSVSVERFGFPPHVKVDGQPIAKAKVCGAKKSSE